MFDPQVNFGGGGSFDPADLTVPALQCCGYGISG